MAKAQIGKTEVWALFSCGPYYDGGDQLISLHKTKEGAKAARKEQKAAGRDTLFGFDIQKYELED